VRERLAANFARLDRCDPPVPEDAGSRLPRDLDRREAGRAFVLTAMEGGDNAARTFRDIGSFDGAVRQLACLL